MQAVTHVKTGNRVNIEPEILHGNWSFLASVPGLPRYAIYCARLIVRGRETLKTGREGMKHHVPIDAPGRARPVASTANMYKLASVRLLSFWLTATCSSAVKTYTYAYRTCVKRSRVYIVVVEATGRRARATRRLPNVYGHVMFHPRPTPFSMFPSPAQLNARNKSRNGEGLGPRLGLSTGSITCIMVISLLTLLLRVKLTSSFLTIHYNAGHTYTMQEMVKEVTLIDHRNNGFAILHGIIIN